MEALILRIHRDKQGNAYPVTAYRGTEDSEGITNAASFRNPLRAHELEALQAYVETWSLQPEEKRTPAVTMKQKIAKQGEALFDAIFNDALRQVYEAYCHAHNTPPPLHLWIEAAELWALPWELLRDRRRNWPLALMTSMTRTMARPTAGSEEASERLPLKMLYIIARPEDSGFLGLTEPRTVLSALHAPENPTLRDAVQADLLRPPTCDQFLDQLPRGYHIVHFDGHGSWDSGTQQGGLCFETPPYQPSSPAMEGWRGKRIGHTVTAEKLQNALAGSGVKLLVLSACKSGQPHAVNAYASVAHAALNAGVPAVLAMRYSVDVNTACEFHRHFYHALLQNQTAEEAVLHARKHVEVMPDHPLHDWFLPVFYQRALSTRLFGGAQTQVKRRPAPCTAPELDVRSVGRERELLEVDRALMLDHVSTVTLTGMAGVGKTTLALALVDLYKAGNAFPGGYFWHTFEVGGTVDAVVDGIGAACMGNAWAQVSPNDRPQIVQQHLAESPSLLIWDNFETVLQHADANVKTGLRDFLTKLPGRSRALVTCRRTRVGIISRTREKTVDLDVLDPSDAEQLTWLHAELEGVTAKLHAEREKIPTFIEAVGNHPLGISLAIPQLKLRGWTLTELIRELQRSVDTLALDETLYDGPEVPDRLKKVVASFGLTYTALSEPARAVLCKLAAAFPGGMPDSPMHPIIQVILEIDATAWAEIAKELIIHNLLRRRALVCHLHPLLRAYAADKLKNDEWRRGVAKEYATTAWQKWSRFRSQDGPQALEFFDLHAANLLHWLEYCEAHSHWWWGVHLMASLAAYYDNRGRWGDWERILLRGIAFADRQHREGTTDEIRAEGLKYRVNFTHDLGTLYQVSKRLDDAEGRFRESLAFHRQRGNRRQEAVILDRLGSVALLRKCYPLATEYCNEALAICGELDDSALKGTIIGNLASVKFRQGEEALDRCETETAQQFFTEANPLCQQALELHRRADDRAGQATILSYLGTIARYTGDVDAAKRYYQESLAIHESRGDRHRTAVSYMQLADLPSDAIRDRDALLYCIRAATILRDLGAAPDRQENLQIGAALSQRVGQDRFVELCRAVAAEPDVGPEEVNAFKAELAAFLKQSSDPD